LLRRCAKPARHSNLDLFRDDIDDEFEGLTTASNAVIDMFRAGPVPTSLRVS